MVPKIIFIVPYRNREQQRFFFTNYMKYILEDYNNDDWEIYFSHQTDNREFNRGATKNIGFLAMREKYPDDYKSITFVFNDVDTIPYKKGIVDYKTTKGVIKHFYGFRHALGGFFSITGEDFQQLNGFPNNWGWGFEDNTLQKRVDNNKNITVDRTTFWEIGNTHIIQLFDSVARSIVIKNKKKYINDNVKDGLISIKNLNYDIVDDLINIKTFEPMYSYDPTEVIDVKFLEERKNTSQNVRTNMFNMRNVGKGNNVPQPQAPPQPRQVQQNQVKAKVFRPQGGKMFRMF